VKYSILYKKSAADELLSLPSAIAHKVRAAINKLANNPRSSRCLKLKGSMNDYRIRIGAYRVIYSIHDNVLIITIIKISHRKSAYR
jgi:mRNA interferase RelE/StbE